MFVRWAPLGNSTFNDRTGGAVAAGLSLNTVSPAVVSGFRAIGAAVQVVDAGEAERHLLGAILAVRAELEPFHAQLQADLTTIRGHLSEADRLAAMPLAGDEEVVIKGMIAALEGALARPTPDTRDVDHLAGTLDLIHGIKIDEIGKALAEVASLRENIKIVRNDLAALRQGFFAAIEKVNDPATVAAVRAKRISAKAQRVVPVVTAELRQLRADGAATLARLDAAIAQLEKAA